ncbi:MAG: hypothetical protein LBT30_08065 [Clostridiales bacterium]|jgi:gas vesicle protein|nr:hypothetical protein [Clostridiales bacterium]
MAKAGIIIGAVIGAVTATLLTKSKKSADDLIKKGKHKIRDKVDEILD